MKKFIALFILGAFVFSNSADAAPEYSIKYTKIGANTLDVPPGISVLHIDACAAGGGGGGGNNAVAPGAGGSGGGAGQWVDDYILEVVYPQRITITIPDGGAGGAGTKDGAAGGDLTITGATNLFPPLNGGSPGKGSTTTYVTSGGDGGGKGGLGGLGVGPTMVGGLRNAKPAFGFPHVGGGPGGGNGGGLDPFGAHPAVAANDGQSIGSYISEGAGTGLQAGGGGAASSHGTGGKGGNTSPVTAGASPKDGYCGGGGGGGPDSTTGKGGKGNQGFVRVRFQR